MDAASRQVFFKSVHDLWIEPELERRRESGGIPPDFKIFRALICLPKNAPPQITFNDDIKWVARMDIPDPGRFSLGDPIYWDQVRRIETVQPPAVAGTRVAFVYLFKVTKGYEFIFDFSPNLPEEQHATLGHLNWDETFGPAIAETLQFGLVERSVNVDALVRGQLQTIGLWPAPALVPYPFQDIIRRLSEGDSSWARKVLVEHCKPSFLTQLSEAWWDAPEFTLRKPLLVEAITAHKEGRYVLSIPALLPQIEGIVTDWMHAALCETEIPFRQESKTKLFREALLHLGDRTFAYRRVVEATISFILDGPVLASFKRWRDTVDDTFPNRHVVEHGDDAVYTEENSLKLILLLDTLHFMMTGRAF